MAENDQNNDEYKFAELDSYDNGSTENTDYSSGGTTPSGGMEPRKNIKRNALIAVGAIVFAMLMYKFIGGMLSGKSTPAPPKVPPVVEVPQPPAPPQQPAQTQIPPEPIAAQPEPVSPVPQVNNSELQKKVDSIESAQQNMQSDISSVNQQVGSVNTNVNSLGSEITKLNQMISELSNQLAKQNEEIIVLMERTKPKPIKIMARPVQPNMLNEPIIYYINAVIPGRAWLIGTNGSTITVREGTKIPGYGIVKLIDSMQGRVLTSSGRVIRFNQDDS